MKVKLKMIDLFVVFFHTKTVLRAAFYIWGINYNIFFPQQKYCWYSKYNNSHLLRPFWNSTIENLIKKYIPKIQFVINVVGLIGYILVVSGYIYEYTHSRMLCLRALSKSSNFVYAIYGRRKPILYILMVYIKKIQPSPTMKKNQLYLCEPDCHARKRYLAVADIGNLRISTLFKFQF